MTRKEYVRKMRGLAIAVWHHPDSARLLEDGVLKKNALGNSMKHIERHAKTAAANFGSYQAAWDGMVWSREYYLGETVEKKC